MSAPESAEQSASRLIDAERGWRGAISGTLVLQALTVLLSIPVATNTGSGTNGWGIVAIILLAFALILICRYVRQPWLPIGIGVLQALTIAGWAISAPLGIVGIIFSVVLAVIFYFRHEYRRRAAAGLLPGQQSSGPTSEASDR